MNDEELVSALTKALSKSNGKGPWWSKSMLAMGPTVIIALVLIAAILGFIPFPVMDKLNEIEEAGEVNHVEARGGQSVMIDVLRTICVNSAQTNRERGQCYKNTVITDAPISYNNPT